MYLSFRIDSWKIIYDHLVIIETGMSKFEQLTAIHKANSIVVFLER